MALPEPAYPAYPALAAQPEPAAHLAVPGRAGDGLPTLTEVVQLGSAPPMLAVVFDARRDAADADDRDPARDELQAAAAGLAARSAGSRPGAGEPCLQALLDRAVSEAVARLVQEMQPRLTGLLQSAVQSAVQAAVQQALAPAQPQDEGVRAGPSSREPPCIP